MQRLDVLFLLLRLSLYEICVPQLCAQLAALDVSLQELELGVLIARMTDDPESITELPACGRLSLWSTGGIVDVTWVALISSPGVRYLGSPEDPVEHLHMDGSDSCMPEFQGSQPWVLVVWGPLLEATAQDPSLDWLTTPREPPYTAMPLSSFVEECPDKWVLRNRAAAGLVV